jgi:outer membrane protein OmpA-like peptidoglycan-associated protein
MVAEDASSAADLRLESDGSPSSGHGRAITAPNNPSLSKAAQSTAPGRVDQKERLMNMHALIRPTALGASLLVLGLGASGCASHKFVRDQVSVVEEHTTRVEGTAGEALNRANAAHKLAEGKFLYEMVMSDDSVKFPVDRHALSPEAEQRLAELVQRLKSENRNVYLEIQGYTDATGTPDYNEKLGEARAEAVRKYLSQQGVALNRMATISYGEDSPVAPNETREGRAQNRRVAIVVLS